MAEKNAGLSRRTVLKQGALATGSIIAGSVATTGTAAAGIGDGRVLDYHLNNVNYDREQGDIVAGHVHDASPYDNDGEWWNPEKDPVTKDAAVGNAYEFNGSSDYVEVPDSDSLSPSSALTLAVWIKTTDSGPGKVIIDKDERSTGNPGYFLAMDRGPNKTKPRFLWEGTDGSRYDVVSSVSVSDGTWHHLAATYDGSTMRIYVDGDERGTNSVSFTGKSTNASLDLMRDTDFPSDGTTYTSGKLDEVRVYDRALSQSEIDELVAMKGE